MPLLPVAEALAAVLAETPPQTPARKALDAALGLALAEDIAADVDSPPHDRAMVDGYAIAADDLAGGAATLRVLEEVTAGEVPKRHLTRGAATRVMTGAPVPPGATAVVMVERVAGAAPSREEIDAGAASVTLHDAPPHVGANIVPRGASMKAGQVVLRAGRAIRSLEIGLLAELGRAAVSVVPKPTVAILATGNELVAIGETPGPGQIRNSNSAMLAAAAREAGASPTDLGIVRDRPEDLIDAIRRALAADVLLLSGGVSAGVLDLVPAALEEAGVRQVFHKVDMKPGKPLWFGVHENQESERGRRTLVFALPGNPVSSWVCFALFVAPALRRLAGLDEAPGPAPATLSEPFAHRSDRPTFHPAIISRNESGCLDARPIAWRGSADLAAFAQANGLIAFGALRRYERGEAVECHALRFLRP